MKSDNINYIHGRDGKVFVWRFGEEDEANLDSGLPADGGSRRKPWLLHSFDVKEMTFCGMDVVCPDEVLVLNLLVLI
jgi:ASTRA-associated protein 1